MKFCKGQLVKIVGNDSGHQFDIGDIVEIRTESDCAGGLSAYDLNHTDYWWIAKEDITPISTKAVVL